MFVTLYIQVMQSIHGSSFSPRLQHENENILDFPIFLSLRYLKIPKGETLAS